MKEFDIVVAGAGASGLMASIAAAEMGMKVLLLEKMERPGRKILITGKGRCNITNTKDWDEFQNMFIQIPIFLKLHSSLSRTKV